MELFWKENLEVSWEFTSLAGRGIYERFSFSLQFTGATIVGTIFQANVLCCQLVFSVPVLFFIDEFPFYFYPTTIIRRIHSHWCDDVSS